MTIISKYRFGEYAIFIFLFTSCLSVCTLYFKNIGYIVLPICCLLLLCSGCFRKIIFTSYLKKIFCLFYLPMIVACLWALVKLGFVNNIFYYEYVSTNLITRMIHIGLFIIILFGAIQVCMKCSTTVLKRLLLSYAWGIFILLGLMGFWQILHQTTGIWCPELETRNHLYFASSLGVSRITSFADEPSYLAPYLIDAMLVFLYFKKIIPCLLLGLLLGFSLSFAGYVEIIILTVAGLFFLKLKYQIRIAVIWLLIICCILLFFPDLVNTFRILLESREELQSGFSMEDTSRTYMLLQVIDEYMNSDIVSALIGNGPSSLKYLFNSSNGKMLYITSNNLYLDILYEGGIISLLCYVVVLYIIYRYVSSYCMSKTLQTSIAIIFVLHLAVSSMYRADYSSERYVSIFIILCCFNRLHYSVKKKNILI